MTQPAATTTEDLWDELLSEHLRKMNKKASKKILMKDITYVSFADTLKNLDVVAQRDPAASCVLRLRPALQHFEIFVKGIESLVNTHADPAGFAWGIIQILISTAMHYAKTFELMTDMLDDMTRTVTRFNRYLKILQTNVELRGYLRRLYTEYIDFCISSYLFYKSLSWYTILKLAMTSIKEKFEATRAKITSLIRAFEEEVRICIDELTVTGLDQIQKSRAPLENRFRKGLISGIPFSKNNFFVGRAIELKDMHQTLTFQPPNSSRQRNVCVIHSMGGVGKTQLAREYIARHESDYDYIFWLAAEQIANLAQGFASIGELLTAGSISNGESTAPSRHVQNARIALENSEHRWLLVYDNAEDWDTIRQFWPNGSQGSIIITTQRLDFTRITSHSAISLPPLQPAEGADLLSNHLGTNRAPFTKQDVEHAKSISIKLGGLPVAIAHMAGFIDKSHSTLSDFLQTYDTSRDQTSKIWSQNLRMWNYQYDKSLDTVWDIALQELSPKARNLIDVLAMLAPDRIPEDLLFDRMSPLSSSEWSRDLIVNLEDRQLVNKNTLGGDHLWSIHRALQLNLLHRLDQRPDARQITFDLAVSLLRGVLPKQSSMQAPSNDNWTLNERWLPHATQLQVVFEQSSPPLNANRAFLELLSDSGNYMWERAFYEQGAKALSTAAALYEKSDDTNPMEHSKALTIYGALSQEVGISCRALGLTQYIKSLVLRRNYCNYHIDSSEQPLDHDSLILLANAWNDLACGMIELASYSQADTFLRISVEIKTKAGLDEDGKAYFNYAENFKNQSYVRVAQGRHEQALELSSKAVAIMERHCGPRDATLANFRFHRAWVLFHCGNPLAAMELHIAVHNARDHIFGEDEAHTLNSKFACATLFKSIRKSSEAEGILRQCLELATHDKWPLECICRAQYLLAEVLHEQNKCIPEGLDLRQQAAQALTKLTEGLVFPFRGPDEVAFRAIAFDHLASVEAGRATMGKFEVTRIYVDIGDMPEDPRF